MVFDCDFDVGLLDCGLLLWLRLVDLNGFVGFNLVVVFCVLCFCLISLVAFGF